MDKSDLRKKTEALRDRIKNAPERRSLSRVLLQFIRDAKPPVPISELRDALGDRGVAAMLFLVAAFNTLPLPLGTSLVSGIPTVLLGWQMIRRRTAVWLPRAMLNRNLSERNLDTFRNRIIPRLYWMEKLIKPRYWPFWPGQDEFLLGILCVILGIMLVIPIPFGNWLPAFSIAIIAFSMTQRDGILLAIGLVISAISMVIFVAVSIGLIGFAERIL